jgi:hypothetical protein
MTRKFLAIGTRRPHATADAIAPYSRHEMTTVWRDYLNGTIRELYQRADGSGVVMVVEAEDEAAVQAMLDKLPLSQAGFLDTQVIGLAPFALWSALFREP